MKSGPQSGPLRVVDVQRVDRCGEEQTAAHEATEEAVGAGQVVSWRVG